MNERNPTLQERENTHGSYEATSYAIQEIKSVIHRWDIKDIPKSQMEALDSICVKIGRILCGDASFKDHWDDIAGYAELGAEECK